MYMTVSSMLKEPITVVSTTTSVTNPTAASASNAANSQVAGNGDLPQDVNSQTPYQTVQQRLEFLQRIRKGSRCDLETPASTLTNLNIKQLLTKSTFCSLPSDYQTELIKLLPECDRLGPNQGEDSLKMTVSALTNEFFAKSCVEYKDRMRNGEFCIAEKRFEWETVVWEPDASLLKEIPENLSIPKAGSAFVCLPKGDQPQHTGRLSGQKITPQKHSMTSRHRKPLTQSKHILSKAHVQQSALAKKVVCKAKAVSTKKILCQSNSNGQRIGQGLVRHHQSSDIPEKGSQNRNTIESMPQKMPVAVTKAQGQVVTTLASCNGLLVQMIKRPLDSTVTTLGVPSKIFKRDRILTTILKQSHTSPKVVTLQDKAGSLPKPASLPNGSSVHKAVSDVISQVKTVPSCASVVINGSVNRQIPQSMNGSAEANLPATVNLERSRQICESSKQASMPNIERSYEICKEVLEKTSMQANMVSLLGAKKIITKPVRLDHMSKCDVLLYKNRHRGKPALTSHIFLALRPDVDGYIAKAHKRRTAIRAKPRLKGKGSRRSASHSTVLASDQESSSVLMHCTDEHPPGNITVSVTTPQAEQQHCATITGSCMCSRRALAICSKCGLFSHAECMSKDLCVSCNHPER